MNRKAMLGAVGLFVVSLTVATFFQNCSSGADPASVPASGGSSTEDNSAWNGSGGNNNNNNNNGGNVTPPPAVTPVMKGEVQDVTRNSAGTIIRGWACLAGDTRSIRVSLYMNRPMGQHGSYFIRHETSNVTDTSLHSGCGVASGAFRFQIVLDPYTAMAYENLPIFVYSQDPRNGAMQVLSGGNGERRVPTQ